MAKLLFTDNIGFQMADWKLKQHQIREVYAGMDCIMVLTDDGRVLQKIDDPGFAARTEYWTRIQQVAISHSLSGLAVGLVADGTCMVSKRALRAWTNRERNNDSLPYDIVHDTVRSWTGIVQVAVSDAFFALDREGKVHYSPLTRYAREDYLETVTWRNIRRIVAATPHAIFGITEQGNVLATGFAVGARGANGDIRGKLAQETGVTDVFPTGSECEDIIVAYRDGTARSIFSGTEMPAFSALPQDPARKQKILDGNFWYSVFGLTPSLNLCKYQDKEQKPVFPGAGQIRSFAVGQHDYSEPFVIAVAE